MNINLSEDLEEIVLDAIREGRYATEGDVIRDALTRLKETLPRAPATPARKAKRARAARPAKVSRTREEFDRHLLAIGLLSRLPETDADFDDPDDEPVPIQGEPLSETVIRERR